jgi:hypothetical protein
MKLKFYLVAALAVASFNTSAQRAHQTENIVLILIDGYRWQELFHGAEQDLLNNQKYNSTDSLQRIKKFWADNIDERRKKLMPFTWNYIAHHGQLYGNRDLGNRVNVENPYWISYPGRAEMLSGFADKKINSNDYGNNTNPNVLEFLNRQKGYEDKVVTFACWDATGRCLNQENSGMLINVPWEDIRGDQLTATEILANEIQHYAPKTFGITERLDFEVYALAKAYIAAKHPKITYIDFGDTDEYAHAGKYDSYLDDIYNLDDMIKKLWEMMQQDPFYQGKTTFFIVPDHGRGIGNGWTSHGSGTAHSNETWFMVMGPDTKPSGEMKTQEQIYETQFASTIARLLGFDYAASVHQAGPVIQAVIK